MNASVFEVVTQDEKKGAKGPSFYKKNELVVGERLFHSNLTLIQIRNIGWFALCFVVLKGSKLAADKYIK